MNLSGVITRLRAQASSFSNRIAGAADFDYAKANQPDFTKPSAWVIPNRERATATTIEEGFSVIVALSNTSDERGQTAAETLDTVRAEILAALLDWTLDSDHRPIRYDEGFLAQLDRSTLWYEFDFVVDRVETAIVSYVMTVEIAAKPAVSLATLIGELEAAIEAQTSATQFDSDLLAELDTIAKGAAGYQLAALPTGVHKLSNTDHSVLSVALAVHHRLGASQTERQYTRGAMLTNVAAMLDHTFWKTASVFDVLTYPDLTFPGDLTRI